MNNTTEAVIESETVSAPSELIVLRQGRQVITSQYRQEQPEATPVVIVPSESILDAAQNLQELCSKSASDPLSVSIKVTELLVMCTGIEGSKKSEIIKKAFQVEDISSSVEPVKVTGFSSHGFTAHDIAGDDTHDNCGSIPELRRPSTLKNFQVALFSAFKILKLLDKTETAAVENEQHKMLSRIIEKYQELTSTDTDFHELMSKGIGLVNLWDVGLNRTVRPFLETFSACFTDRVALCLFININDIDNLYAPPGSSDGKLDFNWRPKIQYLLRPVCQLRARGTKIKCTIFLTYDSSNSDECNKLQKAYDELSSVSKMAFQQMEIDEENIEYEVCKIAHNGDCKLLLEKMQSIAKKAYKNFIPFPHLLLRYILALQEKICITHEDLQDIVTKYTQMSKEDVAVFCKNFTAFGSILDVGQINPESKFVIIKPTAFLVALHKYICKINGDGTIQKSPSISDENDKQIVDILVDIGMAYTYTTPDSQDLLPKLTSAFTFLGHIKHKEKTIQFVSNLGAPRLNINIDVIQCLMKAFPECIITHGAANSTTVHVPLQGVDDHIDISFTFLANVIEMSFDVTANIRTAHIRLVCGEVITSFREIIEEKRKHRKNDFIKYHFAILCQGDEIRRAESRQSEVFSAYRIRHVLPDKLCEDCRKVWSRKHDETHDETSMMVVDVWRQLLEQGMDGDEEDNPYAIPHELKLNGDLSIDSIAMLSKRLAKFDWIAVKILANELGVAILQKEPLVRRKEFTILAMLVQWEHDNHQCMSDSLRKIMARKLHGTHMECKKLEIELPESDSFTKIARDLDMTVLTKEQRKKVVEAVIRDNPAE